MRTSVDTAVVQISFAPVDPARFHVAVGKVYTLEHRSGQYEQSFSSTDVIATI